MSLKTFVATKEVRERFASLRAAIVRPRPSPIRVPPRPGRHRLVGTAFDYLVRFELKRLAPHAGEAEWLAESASAWLDLCLDRRPAPGEADRVRRAVADARNAVGQHRTRTELAEADVADLAAHAMRLAAIDAVRWAGVLDPAFDRVDPDDVADLVALWAVVPWADLVRDGPVLLNPVFRHGSPRVGGADADLIAGSALIDFKVVKINVQAADLNQLVGYWLLAREERRCDPAFPQITHVGVYLARHGLCWTAPVAPILNVPEFAAIEEWFWSRAAIMYRHRGAIPLPPDWPADLRPPLGSCDPEAWARFAAAAEAKPETGLRWGWPDPEVIRPIPNALARWAAASGVPALTLHPQASGFDWSATGGPIPGGTAVSPGQFQRLVWKEARGRSQPSSPSTTAGTPADFPGLVDHYPQAAWDFFLRLTKPPARGDGEPVREGQVVKPVLPSGEAPASGRESEPKSS